jgi:hypothetical protein
MLTPFEHLVKRCINTYHRLRAVHPDLDRMARDFNSPHWLAAFDENGHFVGAVRLNGSAELIASESSVRIGNKEWR